MAEPTVGRWDASLGANSVDQMVVEKAVHLAGHWAAELVAYAAAASAAHSVAEMAESTVGWWDASLGANSVDRLVVEMAVCLAGCSGIVSAVHSARPWAVDSAGRKAAGRAVLSAAATVGY
jgi:hypothetical protein